MWSVGQEHFLIDGIPWRDVSVEGSPHLNGVPYFLSCLGHSPIGCRHTSLSINSRGKTQKRRCSVSNLQSVTSTRCECATSGTHTCYCLFFSLSLSSLPPPPPSLNLFSSSRLVVDRTVNARLFNANKALDGEEKARETTTATGCGQTVVSVRILSICLSGISL